MKKNLRENIEVNLTMEQYEKLNKIKALTGQNYNEIVSFLIKSEFEK